MTNLQSVQTDPPETEAAEIARLRAEVVALKATLADIDYDIGQLPYRFAREHAAAHSLMRAFLNRPTA